MITIEDIFNCTQSYCNFLEKIDNRNYDDETVKNLQFHEEHYENNKSYWEDNYLIGMDTFMEIAHYYPNINSNFEIFKYIVDSWLLYDHILSICIIRENMEKKYIKYVCNMYNERIDDKSQILEECNKCTKCTKCYFFKSMDNYDYTMIFPYVDNPINLKRFKIILKYQNCVSSFDIKSCVLECTGGNKGHFEYFKLLSEHNYINLKVIHDNELLYLAMKNRSRRFLKIILNHVQITTKLYKKVMDHEYSRDYTSKNIRLLKSYI